MRITVVGGGAAGLVASIVAARMGADVTILERQNRIGKKILVTGNGRCNLTNTYMEEKHFHTHSQSKCFVPIKKIGTEESIRFFEELGIVPLIENSKVYPLSEQATSVLDVLRMELEKLGVATITDIKINKIYNKNNKWYAVSETAKEWESDTLIMATGGMAAPQLGCDSMGYQVLEKIGHTIYPTYPTLVHVTSSSRYCKMMQGAKIKASVSIYKNNQLSRTENGEVLFIEDGLSGPPIFQISRIASECQMKKIPCCIKLDLFPSISSDEMISLIYDRIAKNPQKTIEELFIGWVNKRMIVPIIKNADVGAITTCCENLEYDMIVRLVESMKSFEFEVTGTRGFKFAQATAGGISLDEIDLETMASKKASGLYIAGEILDVDGDCGGYNLQWAWSTGYIAGQSAATGKGDTK